MEENNNVQSVKYYLEKLEGYYLHKDAIADIEKVKLKNNTKEHLIEHIFVNTVLSQDMPVDEKCRVLELYNKTLKVFFDGDINEYFIFILNGLKISYGILFKLSEEDSLIAYDRDEFEKDVKSMSLHSFDYYLTKILGWCGLLFSDDGTFNIDGNELAKYDLPVFEVLRDNGAIVTYGKISRTDKLQQVKKENHTAQQLASQFSGSGRPSNYMGLAVISLFLGCFIPGLIAVFYATRVKARYDAGNISGAEQASLYARNWSFVGICLFILIMLYSKIA